MGDPGQRNVDIKKKKIKKKNKNRKNKIKHSQRVGTIKGYLRRQIQISNYVRNDRSIYRQPILICLITTRSFEEAIASVNHG